MQTQEIAKINGADFAKEVYESPVPVVVDFYADWCPPCRVVSPILEQVSSEYKGQVKFLKVDVDDNPELASRYGIMSIPTIVFFQGDRAVDSLIGAYPAVAYRDRVKALLGQGQGAGRSG